MKAKPKHWKGLINLTADDTSYGVFYDPDMVDELTELADTNFKRAVQIEEDTAKRLSLAYNYFDDMRDLIRRMTDDIRFGDPIRDEAMTLLEKLATLLGEDGPCKSIGHNWKYVEDGPNGSGIYECVYCGDVEEFGGEDA